VVFAGREPLGIVVRNYLLRENSEWKWLVTNWTFVLEHGEFFKLAANKIVKNEWK